MEPAELIDHPPRDDETAGHVDLVLPVLRRIRAEPPPLRTLSATPLLAVVATMVALALGIEWLVRQPAVLHSFADLHQSGASLSLADLGVVTVVLLSMTLLMGRRVTA